MSLPLHLSWVQVTFKCPWLTIAITIILSDCLVIKISILIFSVLENDLFGPWMPHFEKKLPLSVFNSLPHQAGIEIMDFHARGWKSDQGGRNSMQEMHGNQTKCMEFRPIKENSNFWTSIFCPGINFSCSKSLWIWWTIDPLILACLKLMTYASFSTKELLAVLMDGNPCTNGWNSMHQNRKNVIASCFFEQSCLRQVKIQDPWQI